MNRRAYLLLVLTTLFWGGNAVAGKLAVGHVSPMLLTSARWGLALVILGALGWRSFFEDWPKIRRSLPLLLVLGATGFTGFNVALYSALNYTSAINTSIEQAAIPMLIFAGNYLLFRQRVRFGQVAGFVLSVAGVALTASHGDLLSLLALDLNRGDALMVIAVVVYSLYTVGLRYKPDVRSQSLMIALTAAAAVTSIPFAIGEAAVGASILPDAQGWGVIAYTLLFPSILAQLFYVQAVGLIGANRAGLFINLVPIFGTILSILILREAFHPYHAVAMVMVLGGIWLAETSGRATSHGREGQG